VHVTPKNPDAFALFCHEIRIFVAVQIGLLKSQPFTNRDFRLFSNVKPATSQLLLQQTKYSPVVDGTEASSVYNAVTLSFRRITLRDRLIGWAGEATLRTLRFHNMKRWKLFFVSGCEYKSPIYTVTEFLNSYQGVRF